jgi:hypothetical protein
MHVATAWSKGKEKLFDIQVSPIKACLSYTSGIVQEDVSPIRVPGAPLVASGYAGFAFSSWGRGRF